MAHQLPQIVATLFVALLLHLRLAHTTNVNEMTVHTIRQFVSMGRAALGGSGMATDNLRVPENECKAAFWNHYADEEILKRTKPLNTNKAKNVIMFLGDGMSLNTVTAARILKGQRQGKLGEEEQLSFEKFPYTGLSKTYCTNSQVPDSACTSTAYLSGVKTNICQLGVTAAVKYNDCAASMDPANDVTSMYDWAQAAGKSSGFITTTSLTHASPSGGYAHVANRMWESDADMLEFGVDPATCTDIAQQLINEAPGRNLDLIMGGGMGKFLPRTMIDLHGNPGERLDGKNLLSRWQAQHPDGLLVKNRQQMLQLNLTTVSNILGIFNSKLMDYHAHAPATQPTLSEMTEVAIKFLSKNQNGYFVFIEGGLIDYGNHANKPRLSLDETIEFEKAIQLARDMTDPEDTLIVVTADHAHPLSISGYPERGNDILGLNEIGSDQYGVKYATLNYALGPEQYEDEHGRRYDLHGKLVDPDVPYPSYIHGDTGVHGGDDVGVYASGPYAHLFTGVMEQSLIPRLMAYASCIGNGAKVCD